MKKWITFFITVFLIGCANNDAKQNKSENENDSLITEGSGANNWRDNTFKELYSFYKNYDSSFTADSFELSQQSTFVDHPAEAIDVNKLQPFSKLISYNTDSTFGVDLFSYNYLPGKIGERVYVEAGEPDMEASLIDVKKKEKKRLLYLGPSYILFEAQWLNKNEMVIGAAEIIFENKIKPLLWKINPTERTLEMYSYQGVIKSNPFTILGARLGYGDLILK